MTTESAIQFFCGCHAEQQVSLLVSFGYELTIVGRESYEVGGEGLDKPGFLRSVNELQHQVLGQADAILDDRKRYPDEHFVRAILEPDEKKSFSRAVLAAFERAVADTKHASSKLETVHS